MSQCLNAQVATPANTTLMAEARAAYTVEIDGEIVVISVRAPLSSNSVVIQRIVEVYDPLVTPNSLLGEDNNLHFAFPGDQVLIPFTLQNGGNIADRYRLNFSSPSGDYNAAILGFHVDTNSNGILDPGEAPIGNVSPLLQQGETVSLLVNIQIPTTTQNGDSADFLLEAESITSPTAFDNQNYARVEVNANQSVFLNLTSDMSVVEPGDKVTFDLDLINRSTATLGRSSFVIDSTSGVLGYLMSFPIDAALTVDPNSVATTESSGAVVVYFEDALTGWTTTYQGGTLEAVGLFYFNDITPAQSIDLSWCATVDSTLTQRLDLRNRAIFSFDSVMVESNENPLTVEERPFLLAVAAVSDIHIGPDGAPRAAAANDQSTSPPTTIPSTGDTTYLRGATYVFDLAIENDSSQPLNFELEKVTNNAFSDFLTITYLASDGVTALIDTTGDGNVNTGLIGVGVTERIFASVTLNESFDFVNGLFSQQIRAYGRPIGDNSNLNLLDFDFTNLVFDTNDTTLATVLSPNDLWSLTSEFIGTPSGEAGSLIGVRLTYEEELGFAQSDTNITTEFLSGIGEPVNPSNGNVIPINTPTTVFFTDATGGQRAATLIYESNPNDPNEFRIRIELGNVAASEFGSIDLQFAQRGSLSSISNNGTISLNTFLNSALHAGLPANASTQVVTAAQGQTLVSLNKRALSREVNIGDAVAFEITVSNEAGVNALSNFELVDTLPEGLRFIPGSTVSGDFNVQGVVDATGRSISWDLSSVNIPTGEEISFVYRTLVLDEASSRELTNTIALRSFIDSGIFVVTTETIQVNAGVFSAESSLIGHVYWDKNGDGQLSDGDVGVKNAIIQMSDGRRITTDEKGRYHVPRLLPGLSSLRIYENSLPDGLALDELQALERGRKNVRLIDVTYGALKSVNFRLIGNPYNNGGNTGLTEEIEVVGELLNTRSLVENSSENIGPLEDGSSGLVVEGQNANLGKDKKRVDPVQQVTKKWGILTPQAKQLYPIQDKFTAMLSFPITAKPEVFINGELLEREYLGNKSVFPKLRKVHQQYVGIPLRDGRNELTLKYVPLQGEPYEETITLFKPGEAVSAEILTEENNLLADGRTNPTVQVVLKDKDGLATGEGKVIELSVDRGEITSTDFRPKAEGFHARIEDGKAKVSFTKADLPQTRLLTVLFDGKAQKIPLVFEAPYKDWQVTGAVHHREGVNHSTGNFEARDDAGLSVLAQGPLNKIGSWLATIGFDSRRSLDNIQDFGLLNQQENDRYEVFGDDSQISHPFSSREPLYLRLEHQDHKFVFGDVQTNLSNADLSRHNRNLTGARWSSQWINDSGTTWKLDLFGAKDNTASFVELVPASEIVVSFDLERAYLVANSDRIFLELYDRIRPDRLIERSVLDRGRDYTIDYTSGRVFFNSNIPAFDSELNPYSIRFEYEVDSFDTEEYTYGGRVERESNGLKVGVTRFVEESGTSPTDLTGVDVTYQVSDKSNLVLEAARSTNQNQEKGSAYSLSWEKIGESFKQLFSYRYSDEDFDNPYGANIQRGKQIVRWESERQIGLGWKLNTELDYEIQNDTGLERQFLMTGVSKSFEKYTIGIRAGGFRGSLNASDEDILVPAVGFDWEYRLNSKFSLELGGTHATEELGFDLPTEFDAGISWQVTDTSALKVGVKSRRRAEDDWRNTLQVRAEKVIAEGVNFFSQFGQQSLTSNDSPSLSHGVSAEKSLTDTISYTASVESNQFLTEADTTQSSSNTGRSASAQDFVTVALGLQWSPVEKEVSLRNVVQVSKFEEEQTSFAEFEYLGNIDDTWSLLSRMRGSYTGNENSADRWFLNHELGISYRPYNDDDFVFIGSVRNNIEDLGLDGASLNDLNRQNYHELSFESYWRTDIPMELSFRYANRHSQLGSDSEWLHTDLKVLEMIFPIWKRLNAVSAGRWLTAYDAGYERYGASLGLIYEVKEGLELELGYNFLGIEDDHFRELQNWNDGVYFELRWAFDEYSLRRASQILR